MEGEGYNDEVYGDGPPRGGLVKFCIENDGKFL
jgi:hypothetical protein